MPKDFQRTDRVGDAIQRELATMITREMGDPRVALVTIAGVRVTRDFAYAKVYFTLMEEVRSEEVEAVLNKAAGFLRRLLAQKLSIRQIPQLQFVYDDTLIKANHMDALIRDALSPRSSND